MHRIASMLILVLLSIALAAPALAKNKSDYLFLVTITKATGEQVIIYTDLYVLSGTATASSVTVGNESGVGSGNEACDSHMMIAVKGSDGVMVSGGKESSLADVHQSWDIAWNDKLTILSQEYQKQFSVSMQKCPFPLVRMVPDKE